MGFGVTRLKTDGNLDTAFGTDGLATIHFGDINDRSSVVSRAKKSPLNYGLLTDLNTVPRTTYLGEVRNPNPDPDLRAS